MYICSHLKTGALLTAGAGLASCACSAAAQLSPLADFADLDGKITLPDRPEIGLIKL